MREILAICIFLLLLPGCENQTTIQTKSYPLLETVVKKNNSDGVLFSGRFLSKGNLDIKEAGFLFSKTKDTWYKLVVKDFSEEFEYYLKTDIEEGALYYVKAYAINDDFVSYGNIEYFESLGFNSPVPVVESFSPVNVSDGYKAYIFGKNFSFLKEKVSITFNGIKCLIFYSTLDTIIYKIPVLPTAKDYIGTLKVNDKEVTFGPISVKNPVILDYYPKSGFDGTLVTIRGDFLTTDPTVFFGIYGCSVMSNKDSVITVKSPQITFSGGVSLRVEVSGKSSTGDYLYTVLSHSISGISNMSGQVGSRLEIYGSSFLQNGRTSTVYFNDSKAIVSSCQNDKIVVYVPNFSGAEAVIRVINGAKESTFAGFIKTTTWKRLNDFPGDARTLSVGIGVNSDGYIGLGSKYYNIKDMLSDWWKYNNVNDSWVMLKDFPGEPRYNSISFAINNKIYVGLGTANLNLNIGNEYFFHDLWEYDIAGNEWSLKKPPPLSSDIYYAISYASALTYNQKAYILTPGKLQVYDPAGDQWSELDAPSFYVSSYRYPLKPFCFNISDRLFWFFGYETPYLSTDYELSIYEYFPVTNTWVLQKNYKGFDIRSQSVSFVLDNKGYFGGGTFALSNGAASSFFWEFNPETFEIIQKENFYRNCSGQSSFVINDKAYVGFGINNSVVSQKDFWKFSQN